MEKSNPKRWRRDPSFVAWLVSVDYAAEGPPLAPVVSEGMTVYLWEAFRAGRAAEVERSPLIAERPR